MRAAATLERQALSCGMDEDNACPAAEPPMPLREREGVDIYASPRSAGEILKRAEECSRPAANVDDVRGRSHANTLCERERVPVAFGPSIEHPDDREARTHSRFVLAAEQFLSINKTPKEVDQVGCQKLLPATAHG